MKKSVVIFITAVCLLITGCGDTGSLSKLPSSSFHEDKQKLTIMHIDADNKRFQDFIEETGKKRYDRRSKRQLSAEVSGKHL